jgi:hypothetical protein
MIPEQCLGQRPEKIGSQCVVIVCLSAAAAALAKFEREDYDNPL